MGITERLARASSRHPWRTVGAWIAALMLAFACIALLLPGRLTTEGGAAGNPEFRQAERIEASAFPPDPSRAATDNALVLYRTHDPSLVSADRHATIIPILVEDTGDIAPVNDVVERESGRSGFEVDRKSVV